MLKVRHVVGALGGVICLATAAIPGVGGAPCACTSEKAFWTPLALESTRECGTYSVRMWRSLDPEAPSFYGVVTIEQSGATLVVVDDATGLGSVSGADIDGSGWPNVVVETYTGGAHCCFAMRVFDLAEALVEIALPASPGGNAGAEFVDLDDDGVCEVVTADDSFAYAYCCYAASPAVRVVLTLDPALRRYVPASFRYPDLYARDILQDEERAKQAAATGPELELGWDGTSKCEILALVLDYLYSGDADAAWEMLDRYYREPDKESFRAEIERVVNASPYYAPAP